MKKWKAEEDDNNDRQISITTAHLSLWWANELDRLFLSCVASKRLGLACASIAVCSDLTHRQNAWGFYGTKVLHLGHITSSHHAEQTYRLIFIFTGLRLSTTGVLKTWVKVFHTTSIPEHMNLIRSCSHPRKMYPQAHSEEKCTIRQHTFWLL